MTLVQEVEKLTTADLSPEIAKLARMKSVGYEKYWQEREAGLFSGLETPRKENEERQQSGTGNGAGDAAAIANLRRVAESIGESDDGVGTALWKSLANTDESARQTGANAVRLGADLVSEKIRSSIANRAVERALQNDPELAARYRDATTLSAETAGMTTADKLRFSVDLMNNPGKFYRGEEGQAIYDNTLAEIDKTLEAIKNGEITLSPDETLSTEERLQDAIDRFRAGELEENPVPVEKREGLGSFSLAERMENYVRRLEKEKNPNTYKPGSLNYYTFMVGSSLPQYVAAAGVTILTKNPTLGAAMIATPVFADAYGTARTAGRGVGDSLGFASLYAAAELLPESIALGSLLKMGGKGFLRGAAKGALTEGAQEMVTEALQYGLDIGFLDEKFSAKEGLRRLLDAGIVGAMMGGPVGGVHGAVNRKAIETQEARDRFEKELNSFLKETKDGGRRVDLYAMERLEREAKAARGEGVEPTGRPVRFTAEEISAIRDNIDATMAEAIEGAQKTLGRSDISAAMRSSLEAQLARQKSEVGNRMTETHGQGENYSVRADPGQAEAGEIAAELYESADASLKKALPKQLYEKITISTTTPSGKPLREEGVTTEDGRIHINPNVIEAYGDLLSREERIAFVAWHELVHRGGAVVKNSHPAGAEEWKRILTVARTNPAVRQLADAITEERKVLAAKRQTPEIAVNPLEATEEALAELEAAVRHGNVDMLVERYMGFVKPPSVSGIRQHLRRVADSLRKVLGKITGRKFDDGSLSNEDAFSLLRGITAESGGEINLNRQENAQEKAATPETFNTSQELINHIEKESVTPLSLREILRNTLAKFSENEQEDIREAAYRKARDAGLEMELVGLVDGTPSPVVPGVNAKTEDGSASPAFSLAAKNGIELRQHFTPAAMAAKRYQLLNTVVAKVEPGVINRGKHPLSKAAAKKWLEKNISGAIETTIGQVLFTPRSLHNTFGHKPYSKKYDTIPAVPAVLKDGVFLGGMRDIDGADVDNFYFAGKVEIGEEARILFVRVRQQGEGEKRFYVHDVFTEKEIKESADFATERRVMQTTAVRDRNTANLYRSIIATILKVNPQQETREPSGNSYSVAPKLSALHNLTEDNLRFADTLGGLAVPSIAVVRDDMAMTGYGGVTLIGTKELADPKSNPVYDADAYTTIFPEAVYAKAKSADADRLADEVAPYEEKFNGTRRTLSWNIIKNARAGRAERNIREMEREPAVMAMFLSEVHGQNSRPVMMDIPMSSDFSTTKAVREFFKTTPEEELDNWQEATKKMVPAMKAGIEEHFAFLKEKSPESFQEFRAMFIEDMISDGAVTLNDFEKLRRDQKDIGKRVVDKGATQKRLEKKLKGKEGEYKEWLQKKILSIHGEPMLQLGRKRVPYTIDNIVKSMTSRGVQAAENTMTFGEGNARAYAAEQFKDLEQMKAASERMGSPENIKEAREDAEKMLRAYRNEVAEYFNGSTWDAMDASMRAIARLAKRGGNTDKLSTFLVNEGFSSSVPEEVLELGVQAKNAMMQAPVPYFESKPLRNVTLSEFPGAVIPRNAREETINILERNGIEYAKYTPRDEAARQRAVLRLRKKLAKQGKPTLFSVAPPFPSDLRAEGNATANRVGGMKMYKMWKQKGWTVLPYKEWVQVRTPAFRRYYGDWLTGKSAIDLNPATLEPERAVIDAVNNGDAFYGHTWSEVMAVKPEPVSYSVRPESDGGYVDREAKNLGVSKAQLQKEYDAVVSRYKGTDEWLKAPNGKDSNLNERQWVLVRTPRFKAWFGNWDFDIDGEVKVIHIPEPEFTPGDISSIKAFFKSNLQGKTVVNKDTGQEIGFYRNGLLASLKSRGETARKLYAGLPEVVRSAKLVDYQGNTKTKEKPNVVGYERYVAVAEVDGKPYRVELKVDLMKPHVRGQGYYYHHVSKVEAHSLLESPAGQPGNQAASAKLRTSSYKLDDLVGGVNPEASKVVDANGEPLVVYHGTGADFSSFDPERIGQTDYGYYGRGFYFASESVDTDIYTSIWGYTPEGANVLPVFLNIKNPKRYIVDTHSMPTQEDITPMLKERGYDGVIVSQALTVEEKAEGLTVDDFGKEIVAFHPTQIKSATGNTGEFSPKNPDIRYSVAPEYRGRYYDYLMGVPAAVMDADVVPVPKKKDMNSLVSWAANYFKGIGEQVHRSDIGRIILNRRSAKNSMSHGYSPEKAQSLYLLPEILKKGKIVETSRKGRGEMSAYFIAAPIGIGRDQFVAIAIVRKDNNGQRAYLHEVVEKKELLHNLSAIITGAESFREDALIGAENHAGVMKTVLKNALLVNADDRKPRYSAAPSSMIRTDPRKTGDKLHEKILKAVSSPDFSDRWADRQGELERISKALGTTAAHSMRNAFKTYNAKVNHELEGEIEPRLVELAAAIEQAFRQVRRFELYAGMTKKDAIALFMEHLDKVGKYTYHGKERNVEIAVRTGGTDIAGSGKSDGEIDGVTDFFNQPENTGGRIFQIYEQLYTDHLQPLMEYADDRLRQTGLLTQAMEDARPGYKWYVPLYGKPEIEDSAMDQNITDAYQSGGGGKSELLKNRTWAAAGRHGTEAHSLFETIFTQAEVAVRRAQMQEAKRKLWQLLDTSPEAEELFGAKLTTRIIAPTSGSTVSAGGQVKWNNQTTAANQIIWQDGSTINVMEIGNARALAAIKDFNKAVVPYDGNPAMQPWQAVYHATNWATRMMGSMYTRFNPSFILRNKVMDSLQQWQLLLVDAPTITAADSYTGAMVNLGKNIPLVMRAIKNNFLFTSTGIWNKTYRQYLDRYAAQGGITTFSRLLGREQLLNLEEMAWQESRSRAEKLVDARGFRKALGKAFDAVNDYSELTTRISAFKALVDSGISDEVAANYVKDVMNFEVKGDLARNANALYPFFTTAIYDARRTMQALSTKEGKILMTALVGFASIVWELVGMATGDDEEGVRWIDKYPMGIASRYLIIPVPSDDGTMRGEGIRLPLGFGLGRLANVVALAGRRFIGGIDGAGGFLSNMVNHGLIGSFSPLHPSDTDFSKDPAMWAVNTFAPQVVKPLWQFSANKNWRGMPIYSSEIFHGTGGLDYNTGFAWTPDTYRLLAEKLYDLSGGRVDVAPESLQFWNSVAFGGFGRDITGAIEMVLDQNGLGSQSTVSWYRSVPVLSGFVQGEPSADREEYYTLRDKTVRAYNQYVNARRQGRDGAKWEEQAAWQRDFKAADKKIAALRKRKEAVRKGFSGERLKQTLRRMSEDEKRVRLEIVGRYREREK